MKKISLFLRWTMGLLFLTVISASPALAEEFHVTDVAGFQNALNTSQSNGQDDTIYLAAGAYQGNFIINTTDAKSLSIRAETGLSAQNVILDGGNSGTVLDIGGSADGGTVSLEDLTIQNGTGSGIYVGLDSKSVLILLNRLIIQNNSNEYRGGGINLYTNGDATIDMEIWNSIIKNNQSQGYASGGQGRGGGIWAHTRYGNNLINLLVVNCLIYRNEANWSAGGIGISASELEDNNVTRGKIINSTITGNVSNMHGTGSERGGGVWVHAYSGNGTIASVDLYNTIVYGNTSVGGSGTGQDLHVEQDNPGLSTVNAYNCNINDIGGYTNLYHPTGVINEDPLFVNSATDNYHLTKDSPCIDSGTSSIPSPPGLSVEDLDGNPRVNGPLPDIGAYEFEDLSVTPDEGTIGTEIEVYGSGFGTKRNKILIGTTALKVLQWTDGWIRASLNKALVPGVYDLTIQPKRASSIVLEGAFTVKPPEISSVEPETGSINDEITIHGFFFGNKKGKVTLGGKNCRVKTWTSEIHFVVPRGIIPGTHELKITNGVGSDTTTFTIE